MGISATNSCEWFSGLFGFHGICLSETYAKCGRPEASATDSVLLAQNSPTAVPTRIVVVASTSTPTPTPTITPTPDLGEFDITLCFCGDINLDDGGLCLNRLKYKGGVLSNTISQELIDILNEADVTCVNNEFPYSNRGTPLANKMFTFRAKPESVYIMQELGVDVVTLANNHMYDYGPEAALDTMETLTNADYVIAILHWGTEYSEQLESVQISTAKTYLDAGADAIIGAHSHCLQPLGFYNHKPIVYSLSNFWFNGMEVDILVAQIHIYGNNLESHLELSLVPAVHKNNDTKFAPLGSDNRNRIFSHLEEISKNVSIAEDGLVTEKETN